MPDWFLQIMAAGAIYGGIRADLKNAIALAVEAKLMATRAHERIDGLLERH